jgi:hypothetical protein
MAWIENSLARNIQDHLVGLLSEAASRKQTQATY